MLYTKAKEGITKRLLEAASSSSSSSHGRSQTLSVTVIIDGPYGIPIDFRLLETIVLIAGKSLLLHMIMNEMLNT